MEGINLNSEYLKAQKNWKEKGSLGVTAQDHKNIGGTPDDILLENPGKTLGELMTDQEIKDYILATRANILENEKESLKNMKQYTEDLKEDLEATLKYLESIGRLPEEI